jgi:hypothetical protein
LALCPFIASAALNVEITDARVARGEYLAMDVASCDSCHVEREMNRYAYPPKMSKMMAGGLIFPGEETATPNITPYALGSWTDQEIFDALSRGIAKDGHVLNPMMPYQIYGTLDPEELYSIIAWLRTLPSIEAGPYPGYHQGTFAPLAPKPAMPRPGPDASDIEKGRYLVTIADCNGCHRGPSESAPPFAGGTEFPLPGRGLMRSANLTPDASTGIGAWTREAFIARFKAMRGQENVVVEPGQPNTAMHWWSYAYMTEDDLGAIFSYLRTMPPVVNAVVKFEPLPGDYVSPNFSERPSTH